MFKVQRKDNGKIYEVLDTTIDDIFASTFFLIYDNNDWRWRPASAFTIYKEPEKDTFVFR